RPLGNDRRRSELKSRADLSKSRLAPGDREVLNGLPMRANEEHVARRQVRESRNSQRRAREPLAQRRVQMAEIGEPSVRHGFQQAGAKFSRVGKGFEGEHF